MAKGADIAHIIGSGEGVAGRGGHHINPYPLSPIPKIGPNMKGPEVYRLRTLVSPTAASSDCARNQQKQTWHYAPRGAGVETIPVDVFQTIFLFLLQIWVRIMMEAIRLETLCSLRAALCAG